MTPTNNKQAKADRAAAKLRAKQDAEKAAAKKKAAETTAKAALIPMPVPVLPIPLSKEEKLNQLLAHYKSDQITPEEYHKQRAAILAEP
jgi:hypothetical protein